MDAGPTVFQQIVSGEAPEAIRVAVATGAMPIPPQEAAAVLSTLAADPLDTVREGVLAIVDGLSPEVARDIARDRRAAAPLLHLLVVRHEADPLVTNVVLNHPLVGPETIQLLIYKGSPETLRLIATLTPKLRAYPHLIEVMLKHHGLPAEAREQLQFLAESIARKASGPEALPEELNEAEIEAAGLASVPGEIHDEMTAEGEAEADKKKGWYERILKMTVGEKIYWAMKGNKEVRSNLVRDSNKMVSLAVMKSPRITLAEIETIANSTNIATDVLRAIAANRDWTAKYPVQRNLAKNPKTPPGIALRFLPRLQKIDLQTIVATKGMAEVIRTSASRMLKAGSNK